VTTPGLPPRVKDVTGLKCGKLTVSSFSHTDSRRRACWVCVCECGGTITTDVHRMRSERPRPTSCGCARYGNNKVHGMSRHPAYFSWSSMRSRCYSKINTNYFRYGGRGIVVCDRWRESFETFWEDMGPTYAEGKTLDRKDNDGNYEPGNCRWATLVEQGNNKRSNVWVETPWGKMTLAQAARRSGLSAKTLHGRRKRGCPISEMFKRPQNCGVRSREC
jgi:hypothetical protein